ncbi:unnamed protein product [Brassicogethes aeneus]|uniref:Amidase domain-containing protein n=1 Tax=Brassicogethes aeneus TaxID=1431903 RepID=A0A9P0FLB5_BRAAE|nr:unnamed protein product [Brassicogethes aeneus]
MTIHLLPGKVKRYEKLVREFKAIRIIIWLFFRLLDFVFIPLMIIRCFKKKKTCPPIDNNILLYKASELSNLIRTQQLTSTLVVKTYIDRIKVVNKLLNAVIDDRFDSAIQEAKYVDDFVRSTKCTINELKIKYPLLGVPITVKGSIDVAKLRNTSGLVTRKNVNPAEKDADAVALAREAGAIPLLTSNIPELCLNWESINNFVGTTKNPYDIRKTAGGSSGGEVNVEEKV